MTDTSSVENRIQIIATRANRTPETVRRVLDAASKLEQEIRGNAAAAQQAEFDERRLASKNPDGFEPRDLVVFGERKMIWEVVSVYHDTKCPALLRATANGRRFMRVARADSLQLLHRLKIVEKGSNRDD